MAIVSGCIFGRAGVGGKPRQCGRPTVATITGLKDNGGIVRIDVCAEHYERLNSTLQGTLYTEDETGQPVALRVKAIG
jgi:hypothetical protein